MKTVSTLMLVLVFSRPVFAGSIEDCGRCGTLTIQEQIDRADIVFAGEVASLSEDFIGCGDTGNFNYAMIANEVFKGSVSRRVNVTSPEPEDACGIEMLERGVVYLVFAEKSDIDEVATDVCRVVKPIEFAGDELAALGDGYPVEDAGGCSSLFLPATEWLLLLGMGGLVALRRVRRAGGTR